ncbi:MAG: response regulator [Planctomycetes bacterium]|nr:response regulator [Planctomycetota bacterium]
MKDRIPVRALVIDDDQSVCHRINEWLTAEEYDVFACTDSTTGLREAAAAPFDLALVDLRMPDVDGSDVIAALMKSSPQTRVLAMSAFPEREHVVRAMQAGACDLLSKPIQKPSLLDALGRQLAELGFAERTESAFNRRLGNRLREIRNAASRTQQDVAAAAGISAAQLSQIELGKTATTTWTLARICGAMKLSLSSFFQGM